MNLVTITPLVRQQLLRLPGINPADLDYVQVISCWQSSTKADVLNVPTGDAPWQDDGGEEAAG